MRIRSKFAGSLLLAAALAGTSWAQQSLDNDAIVKMAKAGLSDNVIVQVVSTQPGSYTVTPDALVALKKEGVSERVLGAMVAKASGEPIVANAGDIPPASLGEYQSFDIGVYHKNQGKWVRLPDEKVTWKTGGFLKSLATDGVVKQDINGRLKGPNSEALVSSPVEFLVIAPDGSQADDFVLVHLHQKSDAREFRTVTGGVFHSSGGTSKDAVPFDQKSVGKRAYVVTAAKLLEPGEYAFLPPNLSGSFASGSLGKAYTFQLPE